MHASAHVRMYFIIKIVESLNLITHNSKNIYMSMPVDECAYT